jgi:hypothetical protein
MRAAALQNQLSEHRKTSDDKTVAALADQFFMSRIRRPVDTDIQAPVHATQMAHAASHSPRADDVEVKDSSADAAPESSAADINDETQPAGYKPRGSYIDVRA